MFPFDKISPYKQDTALRIFISTIVLLYSGVYLPLSTNLFSNQHLKFGLVFVNFAGQKIDSWKGSVNKICYQNDKTYNNYIDCNHAYLFYLLGAILTFIVVKTIIVNFANCVYIAIQPHPELNPRAYIILNRKCRRISLICIITCIILWSIYLMIIKWYKHELEFTVHIYVESLMLAIMYSIIILFDRDLEIVKIIIEMDRLRWEKSDVVNVNWAREDNFNYQFPTPQQLMN